MLAKAAGYRKTVNAANCRFSAGGRRSRFGRLLQRSPFFIQFLSSAIATVDTYTRKHVYRYGNHGNAGQIEGPAPKS